MEKNNAGFTLIELAVVLLIVSLLLGGLLVPLSTQVSQRNVQTTQAQLEQIREALLGFAVVNGRLPCPTTTANPTDPNYGLEDANCSAPTAEGYLPWKTLGVDAYDAWGVGRNATTDPWTGFFRYRVDPNYASAIAMTTYPGIKLEVRDASGNFLTPDPPTTGSAASSGQPVAIVYSTGSDQTPDGDNATYENGTTANAIYEGGQFTSTFNDITIWISRPLLYNRLIAAGRIP